ncbi:MAG: hypothetical protein IT371_00095 [Deltaproteobacteria bacterium]|nr:hypothetical protein [Deltaproteobacteria bacterium]
MKKLLSMFVGLGALALITPAIAAPKAASNVAKMDDEGGAEGGEKKGKKKAKKEKAEKGAKKGGKKAKGDAPAE